METHYVVALFVCISWCLLEMGYGAGCAFDLTQYGLAPGQVLVVACMNKSLQGSAKPLTPPPQRAGEILCLESQ